MIIFYLTTDVQEILRFFVERDPFLKTKVHLSSNFLTIPRFAFVLMMITSLIQGKTMNLIECMDLMLDKVVGLYGFISFPYTVHFYN